MEVVDDWNKMQTYLEKKEQDGNKILTLTVDRFSPAMILEKIHSLQNINEIWICGSGFDRNKILVKCVKIEAKDIGDLEHNWENIFTQSAVKTPPSPVQTQKLPSPTKFSREAWVIYRE